MSGDFDPRKLWAMTDEERQRSSKPTNPVSWSTGRSRTANWSTTARAATRPPTRTTATSNCWVDYKTVAKADSGIYLRGTPQVQIWDYTKEGGKWNLGADKGSGGLCNNRPGSGGKDPLVLADKPFGEWNRFRILQVGERTTVWLNDKLVVDAHAARELLGQGQAAVSPKARSSCRRTAAKSAGGTSSSARFPAVRRTACSAARTPKASSSSSTARIFDGWAGAVENYEVVDGAILCKAGKGGDLFTKDEYDDFVARLEFKLPPGGNNGLAIRYPGTGDAAYNGMCELQVLDTEDPKYAKIDPRQAHGSAYGMVAAHRGYLRPVGQWNYQQVTVKGSTIKVELNGVTILDGDLSKVTEFMDNKPHPGKDRKSGHFGFAGHNDPVEFRNIEHQAAAAGRLTGGSTRIGSTPHGPECVSPGRSRPVFRAQPGEAPLIRISGDVRRDVST